MHITLLSNMFDPFNWYGFLIFLGVAVAGVSAWFITKKRGYDTDIVFTIALVCIPLAFIGLRVYYVFFDILAADDKLDTLAGWFRHGKIFGFNADGSFSGMAGLALYGGLLFAALGAAFIVRPLNKKKPILKQMTVLQMYDLFFVLIILGQVIGRFGNIANGELLGREVTNPAWQWFPIALRSGREWTGAWRLALPFYESFFNLIGFGILLYLTIGKRRSFDGFNFAVYCIWYGTVRTILEPMRQSGNIMRIWANGPPLNLVISVMLILAGLAIIGTHIYLAKNSNKKIFIFVKESDLKQKILPCQIEQKVKETEGEVLENKKSVQANDMYSGQEYFGFEKTIIYYKLKHAEWVEKNKNNPANTASEEVKNLADEDAKDPLNDQDKPNEDAKDPLNDQNKPNEDAKDQANDQDKPNEDEVKPSE
ncbi:MAG: prolipoprotein diacylglyceryl transferase [Firmicutes bacterium]|nr:prolipoprotein diacylglyceryl transferase [Bacillota bacterium]